MRTQNATVDRIKDDDKKRNPRARISPGLSLENRLWSHLRGGKLHLILLAYTLQKLQEKVVEFEEVVEYCQESLRWYTELYVRRSRDTDSFSLDLDNVDSTDASKGTSRDSLPLSFLHLPDALFLIQQWVVKDSHVRWELETHISQCFPGAMVSMAVSSVAKAATSSPTESSNGSPPNSSIISVVDLLQTLRRLPSAFSSPPAEEGDVRMRQLISALIFGISGAHDAAGEVAALAHVSLRLDGSTIAPINAPPAKHPLSNPSSPSPSIFKKTATSARGGSAAVGGSVSADGSFLPPIVPPVPLSPTSSARGPSSSLVPATAELSRDTYDNEDVGGDHSDSPAEDLGEDFPFSYGDEEQLLFSNIGAGRGRDRRQGTATWMLSPSSSSAIPLSTLALAENAQSSSSQSLAALEASQSVMKLRASPGVASPVPAPPPTPPHASRPARRRSRHGQLSPGGGELFSSFGASTSPSYTLSRLPSSPSPSNQQSEGHRRGLREVPSPAGMMPRLDSSPVGPIVPSPPKSHIPSAPELASASPRQPRVVSSSPSSSNQQLDGEEQRHFVRKRHVALSSPPS